MLPLLLYPAAAILHTSPKSTTAKPPKDSTTPVMAGASAASSTRSKASASNAKPFCVRAGPPVMRPRHTSRASSNRLLPGT